MATHTPGPYSVGGELIISADGKIVARVSYKHHGQDHVQDWHESDANRNLFAASPRMLELLKKCVRRLQTYENRENVVSVVQLESLDLIAEVEGR